MHFSHSILLTWINNRLKHVYPIDFTFFSSIVIVVVIIILKRKLNYLDKYIGTWKCNTAIAYPITSSGSATSSASTEKMFSFQIIWLCQSTQLLKLLWFSNNQNSNLHNYNLIINYELITHYYCYYCCCYCYFLFQFLLLLPLHLPSRQSYS